MRTWITCLAASLLLASPAAAELVVETFDGGSNVGGWTYYAPTETVPEDGGNPGAYLRAEGLDTYAPFPRTSEPSIFTGDYRDGVTSLGVDLATFYVDFSADERNCALVLINDNLTPANPDDDWGAYTLGSFVPVPGEGWQSFDFAVPSQVNEWPEGWEPIQFGGSAPQPIWESLMGNVSTVGFHYGDPTWFYIFQMWQLGLDNPRIDRGPVATEAATWGGVKALFR